MRKGIVLKILMGVITTGLAVTGITALAAIDFKQNVTDVSVITKEDIRVEETIADTSPALEEETNIAEKTDDTDENMAKSESMIHPEQTSDAAVVADGQMSIDVRETANSANITEPEAAVQPKVVVQPETAAVVTQPETKTETAAAVTQPEEPIEENHVVTSNTAVCEITIHFPPAVTEEPTEPVPVEENPVYIEIHDCNCGWSTTDYQELKNHMKNHLFNGEAHSYTTVVIKQ